MKIGSLLIAVFFSFLSYGQSTTNIYKIAKDDVNFERSMPQGSIIIDLNTNKQFLTLTDLPTSVSPGTNISNCIKLLLDNTPVNAQLKEINVNSSAYRIGDLYKESGTVIGIIVSVWRTNGKEHGIIASLTNMYDTDSPTPNPPYQHYWDENMTFDRGAYSFIDGESNCTTVPIADINGAVFTCRDFGTGWYLPSLYELRACYKASNIVNQVLAVMPSAEIFKFGMYWSSTETPATDEAKAVDFSRGGQTTSNGKSNYYYVRAVKRF